MDETKAIDQLKEAFAQPLDDGCARRIVFWHDVEGSFGNDFAELQTSGLQGDFARLIHYANADEGSLFKLKQMVLREHVNDDFLIYTRRSRDFSQGGLEGNWLADIELISEHFQADKASMLLVELNAAGAARDAIAAFGKFFGSAERKAAYIKMVPETFTPQDVALGVIAVLLKSPTGKVEDIVKAYLIALHDGRDEEMIQVFEKYDALGAFANLLQKRVGYDGDITDVLALSSHLLLSAASRTLPDNVLRGYEAHVSATYAHFCLSIVRDWLNDQAKRAKLYEISRKVESALNLPERLSDLSVEELADTDVLPCINEIILADLMGSLADGADRTSEALSVRQKRKDLKWFKHVGCYYDLLAAAAEMQAFYLEHSQGFHAASAIDAWKEYTQDWYAMDTAYRAFCDALDACQLKAGDAPEYVRDAAEKLAERTENLYANWFLPQMNTCWVNNAETDWMECGYVRGLPRQRDFFRSTVSARSKEYKRTMVIVSDGLRYEVGLEIARRLEQNTKGTVDVSAMQAIFPSVTEFGMAALLPHNEIEFNWDSGAVFIDGMQTNSTTARQAVLDATVPGARALLAGDIRSGNRASRRELVGDALLVYVYQDKIDSTGEKLKLENDVFAACASTVEEIVALAKIAINDLAIGRVLITADHGFIYTRGPIKEQDKISKADIGNPDVKLYRRHILSREGLDNSVLVKVDMHGIQGGEYYGLALRECIRMKSVPGNKNYAHGGVSLEEMCVPVIELRNKRTGSKGRTDQTKAEMVLVSTSRRITSSMFHVDLYQRDPVSGKLLPAEYELCLTDDAGNAVTDVQKARADMTTPDERARVSRPMFALRAGRDYPAGEKYYLVCRDKETGDIAWKEEFTIDMAFAPTVDFGF